MPMPRSNLMVTPDFSQAETEEDAKRIYYEANPWAKPTNEAETEDES